MQIDGGPGSTPRLTKGDRTRRAMLETTLDLLDELGVHGVTLQVLGERMGMHPTSIYRYFASVDDLLAEAHVTLLDDLATTLVLPEDPRERLLAMSVAVRDHLHRRPGAAGLFAVVGGDRVAGTALVTSTLAALRDLGVAESDVAVSYQALESYVLGTILYDYAGAPDHVVLRRERFAAVGDSALADVSASDAGVDALNERAFRLGLEALLDRIARPQSTGKKSQRY